MGAEEASAGEVAIKHADYTDSIGKQYIDP